MNYKILEENDCCIYVYDQWETEFERRFIFEREMTGGIGLSQASVMTRELKQDIPGLKDFIRDTLTTLLEKTEVEREKYNELIMAVGNKYEGETRHETALRYIRQAEQGSQQEAAQIIRAKQ